MDKILKITRLNIRDMKKRIMLFYLVTSVFLLFLMNIGQYGDVLMPMIMDVLTSIFLYATLMNTLKSRFNFAQSNNVSRNTFIKGSIISIFPIAALMSVIDFAINRTMNLFIKAPSLYDLWFTNVRKLADMEERMSWIQDGSINAIIGSIILSFLIYSLFSIIGLVIGIFYLRNNEKAQVIWAGASIGFWIYWFNSDKKLGLFDKMTVPQNIRVYLVMIIYVLMFSISIYAAIKLIKNTSAS